MYGIASAKYVLSMRVLVINALYGTISTAIFTDAMISQIQFCSVHMLRPAVGVLYRIYAAIRRPLSLDRGAWHL